VNGDIKNPLVLKEMFRFEKYLRTIPNLTHPQSVADLIAELNEQMFGRRAIPDTREGVANLWFFVEGNEVMDQLVAESPISGSLSKATRSWTNWLRTTIPKL
jgi:predicted RND superfamily exporter protein